jgi:hypothetical protein
VATDVTVFTLERGLVVSRAHQDWRCCSAAESGNAKPGNCPGRALFGLFDKMIAVQNRSYEMLSPAEAFAALTLSAIAVDGYLADEEIDGLINALTRMHLFKGYSGEVMRRMLNRLFGILRRDGFKTLVNSAKSSLPDELQEPAFAVATDLILSDGMVTDQEQEFLDQLHFDLGIPKETALKITEVMMIKNRG